MGWDNDHYGEMHNWGNSFFGAGMGIVALLLIGFAIWALVRYLRNDKTSNVAAVSGKEAPKDILDRRFANGEINAEEYQRAKELLSQ